MSAAFLDEVEIEVLAGKGGNGCCSFRREKFVPYGGPNGGDGGHGGSVVLVARATLNTLSTLRHHGHYRGEPGRPGEGRNRTGRSSGPLEIPVPAGTVVRDAATGEPLADLERDGETFVVAEGGRGGRGNSRFSSATNRSPRRADPGEAGQERRLRLELKLLADVGLVGLPNAGKSTLISRISAARPKIASYPFTTLIPNLGVVDWGDHDSFVVADIPGLIHNSHLGEGLGDQFLRHVERTSVLLHLVDVSDLAEPPAASIDVIETELRQFDPALLTRPSLLVATKLDAATGSARLDELRGLAKERGLELHEISAVAGQGIDPLAVQRAGELVHRARTERAEADGELDDGAHGAGSDAAAAGTR